MDRSSEAAARIHEIETQQDEVLRQLVELEHRTESVLAEHAPSVAPLPPIDIALHLLGEPTAASAPNAP